MNEDDCKNIETFARNYRVREKNLKTFVIAQDNGQISESIDGVKSLLLVYKNNLDKNIIAIGPIYNYFEKR